MEVEMLLCAPKSIMNGTMCPPTSVKTWSTACLWAYGGGGEGGGSELWRAQPT